MVDVVVVLVGDDGMSLSSGTEVSLEQTVRQLKHGLGDLKAEWLLMRRDIEQVRHDAGSLRAGQTAITDDTTRLKVAIDLVKTETGRIKAQLDQLTSLVNKLQSNVRPSAAVLCTRYSILVLVLKYLLKVLNINPICTYLCWK